MGAIILPNDIVKLIKKIGVLRMKAINDQPILLKQKIVGGTIIESRIRIGKNTVNVKSSFTGSKRYSDLLFSLICQKLSA
jgi:hypothetical protein